MNACELTAGVTALANVLAGQMTESQLTMAAALFTQLGGDTLATIAAQQALCPKQTATNTGGKS